MSGQSVRESEGHQRFRYADGNALRDHAEDLGLTLPWSDDLSPLLAPLESGGIRLANRLAVHPMEGFDAESNGAPGELALRRYSRYATGGAGLIWFEATAVVPDGRSNPHQLYLHDGTVAEYAALVEATRSAAREAHGSNHNPVLVLQLTHSGRWSRPGAERRPCIAIHNPELDEIVGVDEDYPPITDDELTELMESYVRAASLAADAGFDGIDVKACHGYLLSELLAAFNRDGRFGGSFENRTRFLRETVKRVSEEVPSIFVTSRLNLYDGLPFPYGFGVNRENPGVPDTSEPIGLLSQLLEAGCPIANVSVGVPYCRPFLGRPFDRPAKGTPASPEHPLCGVTRLLGLVSHVQRAVPELPLVGTGYSWLRQYFPHVAAGAISSGQVAVVGVGRMAFAYPDFARDLVEHGALQPKKCCIACSGCTELMRGGGPTGCIMQDREFYRLPKGGGV